MADITAHLPARDPIAGNLRFGLAIPVLIYFAVILLPVRFYVGPLQMTGHRMFLALMLIPLIFNLIRGKCGKPLLTDYLFIGYCLWVAVAMRVSSPQSMVQNAGVNAVELLGGYLLARTYIQTAAQFKALVMLIVWVICLTLPLAIIETLSGNSVIVQMLQYLPGTKTVAMLNIDPRMGLERVQSMFTHPIHYGLFCSTSISLLFVGMSKQISVLARLTILALISVSCFLSLSSGAILSLALQLFLVSWLLVFSAIRSRWILLIALAALAYVAVDLLSNRTPIRVFLNYATFSAHNAYWRSIIFEWGLVNIWANPVFGIGLQDWVRPSYMRSGSMDNYWLVVAVRHGLPGFAILICGYLWGIWRVCRAPVEANGELARLRSAWVICFAGLTFTLCTVHIWTEIYSYVFFLFGAGMWMITPPNEDSPSTTQPKLSPALCRQETQKLSRG